MFRQLITCTAVIAATGLSFSATAQNLAKDYPNKPVRMIVPFPPGGGTDILSRVISSKLTEVSHWTVVPDNRAGAGGTIGITEAVKAAPTGYDMVMGQKDNVVLGPYLYKNLSWNPTRDLTPVAHVAYTPIVIATAANSPYKTLADVIAAAKKNPSKITYGSPGNGTSIHLAGVMLEKAAGIQLTHVPYKGSNPAMMDALAGNVDLLVSSVPSAIGQIKSGKMRAIAVTSASRSTSLPDTPTLAESGLKGFNVSTWYGIFMPRNTPTPIVNKVNAEVNKLLAMPEVKEAILTQGAEPQAMSVQAFDKFFQADFKANKAIVEASGATIQ
ncbi:tripartite tricarboxylate transporter substrate binding protein [Comamonas testosteroni]|uniref:Tripartite tricarboxylate transporter substrate binding protein n=1 Tax=Comamonas testosteroni TaxID=285 RepID=A0A373FRW1_COMTE|nr:tripartite tricarboxylate transporter substrate binding protein [Comamonas testosteroni]RGE46893.1 tripartite tricarboxylate transporter substrate binding protein [Comamonas testosteroni]